MIRRDRQAALEMLPSIVAVILALYTLRVLGTWQAWHLPDNINLPVHETGHLLFSWGGEVVTALGGTVLQLLMPIIFAVSFHRRADGLGTGIMIWWAGESAINVARYVADARAQLLPLVGGGEHDWTFLLTTWNVIDQDQEIAVAIRTVGAALMILGTWWVVGRASSARRDSPASSARRDSPASSARLDSPASGARRDSPASSARRDSPASSARRDSPASSARRDSPASSARLDSRA